MNIVPGFPRVFFVHNIEILSNPRQFGTTMAIVDMRKMGLVMKRVYG